MLKLKVFVVSLFFVLSLNAQDNSQKNHKGDDRLKYAEITLNDLFEELFLSNGTKFIQPDSIKLALSEEIQNEFLELLIEGESFDYPFDSLKRIGIRTSKDKKVRTYTWSVKLEKGQHRYYGFIQKKEGKKIKLFPLKEELQTIPDLEYVSLDHKHWYGVNYYEIIDFKYRGKKHYALLGMRNNGYVSKTKTIEVLYFTGKRARFGKRVFTGDDKKLKRIMFEYSHKTSMVLNYNPNYKMLVFDHLAPPNSGLKDIKRFYGPDGSYDAYEYNGQKWVYKAEAWIVNERNKKQEDLRQPHQNKTIYQSKQ